MFKAKRTAGFTLLEMSLVIVIGGVLMASLANGYRIYLAGQKYRDANAKLALIQQAIENFPPSRAGLKPPAAPESWRYPCPADPTLPAGSPNAGQEFYKSTAFADCASAALAIPLGQCMNAAGAVGASGVCRAAGAYANSADGSLTPYDSNNDGVTDANDGTVLIGAVPYAALSLYLPVADADPFATSLSTGSVFTDPWGRQFMYAVTTQLTANDATAASQLHGSLDIVTEGGVHLVSPNGSASYVLYSAGEDGLGAYVPSGKSAGACPAAGVSKEAANCNHQSVFVSGLRNMAPGDPAYFDDIIRFAPMKKPADLWTTVSVLPWTNTTHYNAGDVVTSVVFVAGVQTTFYYSAKSAHTSAPATDPETGAGWAAQWTKLAGPPPPKIYNTQLGSVGVGTPSPAAALDIENTDPAGSGAIQSGVLITPQICDQAGQNCFPTAALGGSVSAMACPAAPDPQHIMVMTGVANGAVQCASVLITQPPQTGDCPAGQLLYGWDTFGGKLCKCPNPLSCP